MRVGHFALALAALGAGCSLIVQFNPDGQPCGTNGECLTGYTCISGHCRTGESDGGGGGDGGNLGCDGVVCDPPNPCQDGPGTCNPSTGRCVYPAKPATSLCTDNDACTLNDHCDGDGGCVPTKVITCTTPPTACHSDAGVCDPTTGQCSYAQLSPGARCEDGDPCTVGETCGAGDVCSGGSAKVCTTPPNTCTQSLGSCQPGVGCVYPPRAGGTCDDGNACTVGDACDAGACVPGVLCPPPLPCQIGSCQANGTCTFAAAPDGTSCGPTASARCCSGNCVDISTNALNCGGCGIACVAGYACESVAALNTTCTAAPANTSGRCTCNSLLANTCPRTQTCRSATPGNNRCSPNDAGVDCAAGEKIQLNPLCPQYCVY
jgi:hypothetical protein